MKFQAPIVEHALPEARICQSDEDRFTEMLAYDIPGFIIRSEIDEPTPEEAMIMHSQTVVRVGELIRACTNRSGRQTIHSNFEAQQAPIGILHHDAFAWKREQRNQVAPFVHTTVTGGGDLILAQFGTFTEMILHDQHRPGGYKAGLDDHPHDLLLNGLVDTRLVNPNIFLGQVTAGDSVLVSNNNDHASWHRFDTNSELGERSVTCTDFI